MIAAVAAMAFSGISATAEPLSSSGSPEVSAESREYVCRRPAVSDRLFVSKAVEDEIARVKSLLTNKELAWMFENCFPNTLDTTVHFRMLDGKPDTFVAS